MLKAEALEFLSGQARLSAEPKVVHETPFVKKLTIDGAIIEIEKSPEPREHEAKALTEIIALANRFHEDGRSPVVWYYEGEVVLVIDDALHRVDTATFSLVESDAFKVVCQLRTGKPWFDQKAFVRLLRIDLAGTLDAGILLNAVRKVVFRVEGSSTGVVTRHQESMGREINSSLASDSTIPEVVTLRVPVYKTAGERHTYGLNCAVEIDHEQHRFQLLPLPDEIERVQHLAMDSIRERLVDGLTEGIPAYYGRP